MKNPQVEMIKFAKPVDPNSTILECFAGKNLFITGGLGFMGKALIEKLLRSCPDIGNIYLLIREKKQQTLQERVQFMIKNVLFDTLREQNPNAFKKIIPIKGDCRELRLGMSDSDRKLLIDNVSIVYHIAATVRFDEPLSDAIIMNTRSTREVCELLLELKTVTAFVHFSTAYSQIDKQVIEEKTYRSQNDWRKLIKMAENVDPHYVNVLGDKILNGFPNTYTYSKALAEDVIIDLCQGKIPTIIFRPTIVVSMYKGPMPGWNDNLNGPVGLLIGCSKGLIRSVYASPKAALNFNAVDGAINFSIKATWIHQFLDQDIIAVYNCASNKTLEVKSTDILKLGTEVLNKVQPKPIWYMNLEITNNKYKHLFNCYLFHMLPALIVDLVLRCMKKPPRLFKVQRKVFVALYVLSYFMRHYWSFKNDKLMELDEYLHESDKKLFYIDLISVDLSKYFEVSAKTVIPLILKEDVSDEAIERNSRLQTRMKYVHNTLKFVIVSWIVYFLFNNLFVPACNMFLNYLIAL